MAGLFAMEEVKSRHGGAERFGSQRKSRTGKGFAQTACEEENKANFSSTLFILFKKNQNPSLLALHRPAETFKSISRNDINS